MIDGIRDLLYNGKPLVVEASDWRAVEARLRKARIKFWAWKRFTSSDGGDCAAVSVPAKQYKRAQAIAGMSDEKRRSWGALGKVVMALFLLGLVAAYVMAGGAL